MNEQHLCDACGGLVSLPTLIGLNGVPGGRFCLCDSCAEAWTTGGSLVHVYSQCSATTASVRSAVIAGQPATLQLLPLFCSADLRPATDGGLSLQLFGTIGPNPWPSSIAD